MKTCWWCNRPFTPSDEEQRYCKRTHQRKASQARKSILARSNPAAKEPSVETLERWTRRLGRPVAAWYAKNGRPVPERTPQD